MHEALGRSQLQLEAFDLPLLGAELRSSRQGFRQAGVPVGDELGDRRFVNGADDSTVVDGQSKQSSETGFGVVEIVQICFGRRPRVVQLVASGGLVDRSETRSAA